MQPGQTLRMVISTFTFSHSGKTWSEITVELLSKAFERKLVMLKAGTDISVTLCSVYMHSTCFQTFSTLFGVKCTHCQRIKNASNVFSEADFKDDPGTAADGDCSQTLSDGFPRVAITGDVPSTRCRAMQGFMLFTLMQQLPLLPHPGLYTYVTHTALRAQHTLPAQALKIWKKQ